MSEPTSSDEQTVVTTYVPAYQKREWAEHAERLDMSQSEFVKAMVQAGRRGFENETGTETSASPSSGGRPQGSDAEDGDPDLMKSTVLSLIEEEGAMSWETLLDAVVEDLESDLESTIQNLLEANEITHSPRQGGYVLLEGNDGERH
ncbi:MAG: DUF5805 domain-containing protein [Halanaeroarchaeum sp.]